MATNTYLGGVFMTDTDGNITTNTLISTENVCGLIFDTACVGGLATALNKVTSPSESTPQSVSWETFGEGNVVELNTMADIKAAGLDETVLSGIAYYHVRQFFTLTGNNQRLFVMFMDSTTDTKFESVEKMQLAANGIIYQIGVWTAKPYCVKGDDDKLVIDDDKLLSYLHSQTITLGGKIGVTNFEGNSPVNILLSAPVAAEAEINPLELPDINSLNMPKLSVLLGQASNKTVRELHLKINLAATGTTYSDAKTKGYIQVGAIGAALACLCIAPAEESMAHVRNFNLSTVMTAAELGIGKTTISGTGDSAKWADDASFTNIKTLSYTKRNVKLHQLGYIFLTTYSGIENGVFFSSDETLTSGDYRTIARCRVIHKARRVVRLALLPYVNEPVEVDAKTGQLSDSMITEYQNVVLNALDANMVDPGTKTPQISGRQCTIDPEQNILENDELHIDFRLVPMGCTSAIFVTEGFTTSVSE